MPAADSLNSTDALPALSLKLLPAAIVVTSAIVSGEFGWLCLTLNDRKPIDET